MAGSTPGEGGRWTIFSRPAAAALCLGLFLAGAAAGQEPRAVSPDDMVRVRLESPAYPRASPGWTTGRAAAVAPDSLWLRVQRLREPVAFAVSDLVELQVATPRTLGQGMLRGALFGALAGAGTGLLLGAATGGGDEGFGSSSSLVYWGGTGAVVGVPLGALFGAAFRGTRWVPARLPPLSLRTPPAARHPPGPGVAGGARYGATS
jgi:hypothetical protein